MAPHTIGTREEWLAARLDVLPAEKELTRRSDELAQRRCHLPWLRVEKHYRFATEVGEAMLRDLFGAEWDEGRPSCSAVTIGLAGSVPHIEHHDVAFVVVSRSPLDKPVAYKRRMGWDLRWVSSLASGFQLRLPCDDRSRGRAG